jgi:hypothetical protein
MESVMTRVLQRTGIPKTVELAQRINRNLYEAIVLLPQDGVGTRVQPTTWKQKGWHNCYYKVTRVKLDDKLHGKVWGIRYWRGHPAERGSTPTIITGGKKQTWTVCE